MINSFFVVRGERRTGLGLAAVREIVNVDPGPWSVAFQDANAAAVAFWRSVARAVAGDAWREERRPVPHRPELPPTSGSALTPPVEADQTMGKIVHA